MWINKLVSADHPEERKELMSSPTGPKMSQREAMMSIWAEGVRGRTLLGIAVNVFQQRTLFSPFFPFQETNALPPFSLRNRLRPFLRASSLRTSWPRPFNLFLHRIVRPFSPSLQDFSRHLTVRPSLQWRNRSRSRRLHPRRNDLH
jgi:hypothetical protein